MSNYSILIIDDSPVILLALTEFIQESELAITILKAHNGITACKIAENKFPDLIITDWEMPEMDGIETIKVLKSKESTKDIPVIMCSGRMTTSENLKAALRAGAVDFIRKPIDKIELIARVNSMLLLSESHKTIKKQNEEIAFQYDKLTRQNLLINQSLEYASKIQTAVLSSEKQLEKALPEHFVLFKPRDVVSGDFYWIRKVNKYIVVAVTDCTGHGVPGAFLSMLGVSFLNEIVQKREITQANMVLEKLRDRVKTTLDQTGKIDETTDGMDISFVLIDTESNKLQFAGANHSLYIYRNRRLIELEGDNQPIGIYEQEKPFTNHEFQLEKGDAIYCFTDGYVDQFGGNNNSKFLWKRLKALLLNMSEKRMHEQKQILEQNFNKWKGDKKQIDDMLIVGFRL